MISMDLDLTWAAHMPSITGLEKSHLKFNIWHCIGTRLFIARPSEKALAARYVLVKYNIHEFISVMSGSIISPILSPIIRHQCNKLWPHRHSIREAQELALLAHNPPPIFRDPCIILSWSDEISNYYHLFFDLCARIDSIVSNSSISDMQMVVLGNLPDLAKRVIRNLYPSVIDRIIEIQRTKIILRDCIVPYTPEPSYLDHRLIKNLNRRVNCHLESQQTKYWYKRVPSKCVYISRGMSRNGRTIHNEDEIIQELSALGFSAYAMDHLDVSEQWFIFQNASLIVSPHGAALTNLLACRTGTKVFELLSHKFSPNTIRYIAKALDLDYSGYIYDSPEKPDSICASDLIDQVRAFTAESIN